MKISTNIVQGNPSIQCQQRRESCKMGSPISLSKHNSFFTSYLRISLTLDIRILDKFKTRVKIKRFLSAEKKVCFKKDQIDPQQRIQRLSDTFGFCRSYPES